MSYVGHKGTSGPAACSGWPEFYDVKGVEVSYRNMSSGYSGLFGYGSVSPKGLSECKSKLEYDGKFPYTGNKNIDRDRDMWVENYYSYPEGNRPLDGHYDREGDVR